MPDLPKYDPYFDRLPKLGDVVTLTLEAEEREMSEHRSKGKAYPDPNRENNYEAKILKFFGPTAVILDKDLKGGVYRQLEDLTLIRRPKPVNKWERPKEKKSFEELRDHELSKTQMGRRVNSQFGERINPPKYKETKGGFNARD